LLLIRATMRRRKSAQWKVLIPEFRHGTNPATGGVAVYDVENIKSNAYGSGPEHLREHVNGRPVGADSDEIRARWNLYQQCRRLRRFCTLRAPVFIGTALT